MLLQQLRSEPVLPLAQQSRTLVLQVSSPSPARSFTFQPRITVATGHRDQRSPEDNSSGETHHVCLLSQGLEARLAENLHKFLKVISFSQSLRFSRVSSCLDPLCDAAARRAANFASFRRFWRFHLSSGGVRVHGARLTGHQPARDPVQINKLSIYRTVTSSSRHMLHRLHYRQDVRRGISKKKLRAAMTEQRLLYFLFNSRANAHAGDGVIV